MLDCNNSLIMNNIMGAYYGGFHLEGICLNNRILNNSFTHGVIGLDLEGESLSTLDLGNENTISGKPIIFLKGEYDPEKDFVHSTENIRNLALMGSEAIYILAKTDQE